MNSVQNSILILRKDFKKTILIYFQLTLILMYFYIIILNTISYENHNYNFNRVWKNKEVFSISYSTEISPSEEEEDKAIQLEEFLRNNNLQHISFKGGQIPVKKFEGIEKVQYIKSFSQNIPGIDDDENALIEHVAVSQQAINEFDFKLSEGRWFTENEYINNNIWSTTENKTVPVILGENFKNIFSIGDQFLDFTKSIAFEVIGFLDKNQYFSSSNLYFYPSKQSSLDKFMITPYNTPTIYKNFKLCDGVWKLDENSDYSEVLSLVKNKIEELNFNAHIEESSKYFDMYDDSYKETKNVSLLQQVLLSLIVLVGMTISLILYINKNKQMLAIHRAFGATERDIIKTICFIPNIINIFAIITILIFIKLGVISKLVGLNFLVLDTSKMINITALIISIIFTTLIILISTALPIYKIKNESLNTIMKGD